MDRVLLHYWENEDGWTRSPAKAYAAEFSSVGRYSGGQFQGWVSLVGILVVFSFRVLWSSGVVVFRLLGCFSQSDVVDLSF